jgi:hypothetical protein
MGLFSTLTLDRLKAYVHALNFIEVNSTAYEIPDFQLVKESVLIKLKYYERIRVGIHNVR